MENFQLKKIVFDWKGKKYERKENVVIDRVIFLGSSQAFPPLSEKGRTVNSSVFNSNVDYFHSTVDLYRFTSKLVVWLWVSIQRNITGCVICLLCPLLISGNNISEGY